jgi:hypothetical protein
VAEVVSIKTAKPKVESVTVKLSVAEATDIITAYKRYYGLYSTPLVKVLERALAGDTGTLITANSVF